MPVVHDPDRFNLPVLPFLTRLLRERFPELNVAPGSVVHDLLLRPAALILQPQRDFLRVVQRNQSLGNFDVMNETAMDGLAANFLVSRRSGTQARGVQRVFFSRPQPVSVGVGARFYDDQGRVFRPLNPVAATQSQLLANLVSATGEYYLDVPVVADRTGEEYAAVAGTVLGVQGVPGAVRTVNEQSFAFARNADSNTELYARLKDSLTNRDLVKKTAIAKAVTDAFDSVRAVEVVGFGDVDMTRDVTTATLATQELFRRSFCKKVNLPLDGNGEVKFVEDDGVTVIVTPVGGYVGAVYDTLDLDYTSLTVTFDGQVYEQVAVQPGFAVRLFGADDDDPDRDDRLVRRVAYVPTEPGGPSRRVLMFDRPLSQVSQEEDATDKYPYTILGGVHSNRFHVGGKIDLYVDSTADVERTVTLNQVVAAADGVYEVPLVAETSDGVSPFENGVGFASPVLAILKIEELDPAADVVVRTLLPDTHYVLVRAEQRGRYAQTTTDALIIRGLDDAGAPLFDGARLRITYLTNADFDAIQAFVDDPIRRDVTKDIQVFPPQTALLDVDLAYRGTAAAGDVTAIIAEYLVDKGFAAEITVNEIVSLLAFFGVTDVAMPVTLTSRYDRGNGELDVESSQDRLRVGRVRRFRAVPELSVRKLG